MDVLVEMRRQGKTGSILSDGRKNVKKWPMVNFIFKSTMGTFLVSCVNSEKWKDEVGPNDTKGDWLAKKLGEAIETCNRHAGGSVVDQVVTDSAGD